MDAVLLESVGRYIKGLPSTSEKSQISRYIDRQIELGPILKRPVSAPLKSGIHELRPGAHRLLFFFHKGSIVICHAFRKRTDRVPDREIVAALSSRARYMREVGDGDALEKI